MISRSCFLLESLLHFSSRQGVNQIHPSTACLSTIEKPASFNSVPKDLGVEKKDSAIR